MDKSKAKFQIVIAVVIFGTIGIVSRFIPLCSSGIVFYRAMLASLFLILVSIITKRKFSVAKIKQNSLLLFFAGGFMGLNWVLQFESFNVASVSVGTACYNIMPVFVILLTPIMFKQKLTFKSVICVLIAMLGIVFVSNVFVTGVKSHELLGCIYGVLGGFFYALGVMTTKKMSDIDSYDKIIFEFLVSMLIMIPYVIVSKNGSFLFNAGLAMRDVIIGIIAILALGIVHTGIAYIMYYDSVNFLATDEIAIFSYIEPVTALILSFVLLHEKMNIYQLFGTILILASTFVANFNFKKNK